MSTMWEEIRYKVLRSGSKLNLLIGINVALFLIIGLINVFETLTTRQSLVYDTLFSFLTLPAYLPKLLLRFWTPVTYMFMNEGILSLLFNMLWLFWVGQILEEYLGSKKLLTVYILGGLAGAVFYIAAYNIFPLFAEAKFGALAVGAPASVLAVIVATATLLPDYTFFMMFFGAVKLKWLALVYVVFDLLSIVGPNAGGEFAHLGAAILGFVFIKQLNNGNAWGGSLEKVFKPKSNLKVAVKNSNKNSNSKPRQEEIDHILDKISQSGYDSLTKQEKETLFRASNEDKG
jgi:membrane associated rhomboid family serine protease